MHYKAYIGTCKLWHRSIVLQFVFAVSLISRAPSSVEMSPHSRLMSVCNCLKVLMASVSLRTKKKINATSSFVGCMIVRV
jgi:hypothetical protein